MLCHRISKVITVDAWQIDKLYGNLLTILINFGTLKLTAMQRKSNSYAKLSENVLRCVNVV